MNGARAIAGVAAFCAALLTLALAGRAAIVDRDGGSLRPSVAELEELHGRWARFSDAERERYRSRYVELARLAPEARAELTEHISRLDELARMVFASLEPRIQERLLALDAAKRRELLREMAIDEARALGQGILDRLPAEDRARLEETEGTDRVRFLVELRRRQDKRLEESLRTMAAEVGMTAEELARLETLAPEQRRARFLEVVKRRVLRIVEQRGLPDGISPQRWEHALALEPREFYLALLRMQGNAKTRLPLGKRAAEEASSEGAAAESAKELHSWERVRAILRGEGKPEERLELADLSTAERRTQLRSARRAQVVTILEEEGLLDTELACSAASLPDAAFFSEVRDRARAARDGR